MSPPEGCQALWQIGPGTDPLTSHGSHAYRPGNPVETFHGGDKPAVFTKDDIGQFNF